MKADTPTYLRHTQVPMYMLVENMWLCDSLCVFSSLSNCL